MLKANVIVSLLHIVFNISFILEMGFNMVVAYSWYVFGSLAPYYFQSKVPNFKVLMGLVSHLKTLD
jgi:hypothetical protein